MIRISVIVALPIKGIYIVAEKGFWKDLTPLSMVMLIVPLSFTLYLKLEIETTLYTLSNDKKWLYSSPDLSILISEKYIAAKFSAFFGADI